MDVIKNVKETAIKRIITGRIPPGVDLIRGIKEICREFKVKHGYIPMIIGSLENLTIIYAVPDETKKLNIKYSENTIIEGPLELLHAQGLIGEDENSDLSVHVHILVSDRYMRVFGGHLVEGGSKVAATAEIVIHEIKDTKYIRSFDEETGFNLFKAE
ncbi:MAG: DNA-binding protein [Bacillota bacterium]|jgi:predicted DNA-binding protein with PD1-like motif|nr:DNA-binding protein [Bacillota bacterium]